MKITYIELENFEAIKYCMHTNRIRIDLSKSKNKVCLLIGPNGSGKTVLLSLLTPFATIGNLDVRDGYNLIIPHKNGMKKVHLSKGRDFYEITHYYTASKDTHTTKSFLTKNGEELNPNGNVTSFKEVVKEELGIELDYLKLTRLGNNVKSLIGLSSTERKVFMGKLLDEIGTYLTYYKDINTKLRTLKDMLSFTVEKLKKSTFDNKEEYEEAITALTNQVQLEKSKEDTLRANLAVVESALKEIGDLTEIRSALKESSKDYTRMMRAQEKLGDQLKDLKSVEKLYEDCKNMRISEESMVSATEVLYNAGLTYRNTLEDRVRRLSVSISKASNLQNEIERLEKLKAETVKTIREREKLLDGLRFEVDLASFEEFLVFLKKSELELRKIQEFGQEPIKRVIGLTREKKNVAKYIEAGICEATDTEETDVLLRRLGKIQGNPICNENGCIGYKMAKLVESLLKNREVHGSETFGFLHDMEMIYYGLYPIFDGFKPFAKLISSLPEDIQKEFLMENIFKRIENGDSLYDIKRMDQFYTILKEQDGLEELREKKAAYSEEIRRIEQFDHNDGLSEEYHQSMEELETCIANIKEYKEKILSGKDIISDCKKSEEAYLAGMEALTRLDEVERTVADLNEKWNRGHDLSLRLHELQQQTLRQESTVEQTRKELEKLRLDYASFKDLHKNAKKYEQHYDNMEYLKRSLSSSKDGIPTIIIKHYLRDTVEITNQLLDVAFDGTVTIGKFNITADEFTIPTYVNDKLLPDAKLASQGQVSLITVALAFALVNQSLHGYNILSLDEIDGPLDQSNRRKFIEILESQIERIGAEQVFMITHNDMFSYYPVDIIDLTGENKQENYKLANFITIEKE